MYSNLLGIKKSPEKAILKMFFLFQKKGHVSFQKGRLLYEPEPLPPTDYSIFPSPGTRDNFWGKQFVDLRLDAFDSYCELILEEKLFPKLAEIQNRSIYTPLTFI